MTAMPPVVFSSVDPPQLIHFVALLCHHADRQAAVAYGLWRLRKDRQRVMGYIEEINALLVPCLRQAGAPIGEAVVLDLFAGLPAEASA